MNGGGERGHARICMCAISQTVSSISDLLIQVAFVHLLEQFRRAYIMDQVGSFAIFLSFSVFRITTEKLGLKQLGFILFQATVTWF